MLRFKKLYNLIKFSNRFITTATQLSEDALSSTAVLETFRTNESNPEKHTGHHEARFYTIPEEIKKQLFTYGGLTRTFDELSQTFGELCLMVRKPTLEVIDYLKATNYDAPVVRYVLYGKSGSGKSLSLAHILHYGSTAGFLLVHVPWVPDWFRECDEVIPSAHNTNRYQQPLEAVEWLKHFSTQNSTLLPKLNLKTTENYIWSKRENTPEGCPLNSLIEQGLNRGKFASDCVGALIKELKKAANNKQCRVLVVIDGFNSFFSSSTGIKLEDGTKLNPMDLTLTHAFLSITRNDWTNGAVVVSTDTLAHPKDMRSSHMPRYLLTQRGFEHMDPFLPVEVGNYSEKEIHSQIDYYVDRKWLQQKKAHDERGRRELSSLSGYHPYTLMQLVAPY